MDFDKIWNWLASEVDAFTALGVIFTILSIVIGGIWAWRKNQESEPTQTSPSTQYQSNQNQNIAAITAHKGSVVKDVHVGDVHHHGLSVEEALNLAKELAAKKGEQDAQIIKSLQETIQALSQQETATYHTQQAIDRLKQGDTKAAEDIFTRIADKVRQKGKDANLGEATALRHLGSLAFLHDTQKALDAYSRSTALEPDNIGGWNQLGHLYLRIGELDQSENAFMTVLKFAGSDQEGQAIAFGNLGLVYQTRSELDQAINYYSKSLAIHEVLGKKEGMAVNYGNLGTVYKIRGELDRAIDYHRQALAIHEALGAKEGAANQYGNLGLVYQINGKNDQAIDYHRKALIQNEALGNKEGMAAAYGNLGLAYQTGGKLDRAIEYWKKSLALFTEIGMQPQMMQVQSLLDGVNSKHPE
ncbi:MAG: tetratricopeptide repeat protein [Nitrosomonas sp.]